MKKKIENKVADTILQEPQEVEVGGVKYSVAPPTTATLIRVSELVSEMPHIKMTSKNILYEVLNVAKDCRVIGDIIAVLILGDKNRIERKIVAKYNFLGMSFCRQAKLAEELLQNTSPKELNTLAIQLLMNMEISDFFGLSTSLIEVNLIKPTRGVEKTIASGL
ncbi:MAG: hypothetical protein RSF94_07780 [Rikenellaceae bacterium]